METQNLRDIIIRQKETLAQLEAECRAMEGSDLAQENMELKAALGKLRADFDRVKSDADAQAAEAAKLKDALYEQMYTEKTRLVDMSAQKLDVYFQANAGEALNRLVLLENKVKARIDGIAEALTQNHIDAADEIFKKLYDVSSMLDSKLTAIRANAAQSQGVFSPQEREELEALKAEQITDEQIRAVAKKNNMERFVGLNILNVIGIFLLIVGVIAAARYTYTQLPDILKGIMMFALGGIMLVTGEILNQKKANVFSLGLSAGGIGILYVALATSYFGLRILDMYPAIAVCVLITVGAFVLSHRYHSQTIASFALIGGYLPMLSVDGHDIIIYGAMIYFVALNLFALTVSFSKKWRLTSFIGLFLNALGTGYIWFSLNNTEIMRLRLITVLYVTFAFLIYTLIPIVGTYRTKGKFRGSDVVLLALNTVFSSLMMYGVFLSFGWQAYHGALAIGFAVVYLLLGRFVEKRFAADERHAKALFYITGLAFVVLIIPLQFGRAWLSLGWLAEGVLLAGYGVFRDNKVFKRVGFVINALCLWAFILFDYFWLGSEHSLFVYKYLAITLGSAAILGAYMYKKKMAGRFVKIYKYFVIVNVWFFTLYIIGKWQAFLMQLSLYAAQTGYQIDYLFTAAAIVATFLIAYTAPRIKLLSDRGTKILAAVLYLFGVLRLFVLNMRRSPVSAQYLRLDTPSFGITLTATVILAALGFLSVLAVRDVVKRVVIGRKIGIEWYPLLVSAYLVVILTQNLVTQYNLSFSSAIISVIYVLTALGWILFGFVRRYSFIRRFGLAMAIVSVIKLFIIDLASLTQGYRIFSYFALGITLIAISFVYQFFSKRLELKGEVSADAAETDH